MEQGSSFVVGYVLASPAGISIGFAMLRSAAFPRIAAWASIVANALGFGLLLPGIGVLLSVVSVLILIAWCALVGWRLLRLPASEEGRMPDSGSQPSSAGRWGPSAAERLRRAAPLRRSPPPGR